MQPCVYILASHYQGTLYVGVTSDVVRRVWSHREKLVPGFTRKYGVQKLVWHELHERLESAISREKAIKKWERGWKIRLIEESNRDWTDLYPKLISGFYGSSVLDGYALPL